MSPSSVVHTYKCPKLFITEPRNWASAPARTHQLKTLKFYDSFVRIDCSYKS